MLMGLGDSAPRCEQPTALALADDPQHWLGALLNAHGVRMRRQRVAVCSLLDDASEATGPTPKAASVIIELFLRASAAHTAPKKRRKAKLPTAAAGVE